MKNMRGKPGCDRVEVEISLTQMILRRSEPFSGEVFRQKKVKKPPIPFSANFKLFLQGSAAGSNF